MCTLLSGILFPIAIIVSLVLPFVIIGRRPSSGGNYTDRDWNHSPGMLSMDTWSIIGKLSTWDGKRGYIIRFCISHHHHTRAYARFYFHSIVFVCVPLFQDS